MLQYLILNGCLNRAAVLKHFENHPMSIECFSSPVGVPGHVLVDALHADLQPRAAVGQHVTEMPLQAVIGPGLYCYPDAFCQASFRVPATKSILYQKCEDAAGDLRSFRCLPSLWSPPELKSGLKKRRSQQPGGSGCCVTPTCAWNTQIYVVGKGWGLLRTRADHATALQGSFKHRQLSRCSQKRVSLQYTQHLPSKRGSLSRRWELGLVLGMEQGWSEHSFPLRTTEDLTSGGFWYSRDIFVQFLRHTDRPQGLGREPAMLWKHPSHEKLHKSSPFWASRRLSASLSLTLKQNSLVAFFPPHPHLSLDVYRRLNCSSQRKNPLLMTNGKLLTYEGVKQKRKESKAALNQSSQQETINQDELLHHQQSRYSFPFRNHFTCLPPPVVTSPAECGGCVRGLQSRAGDLQQEEWNFLFWSHLKLRR